MSTPRTFCGPRAEAAMAATRLESMPPERPSKNSGKAALVHVVARAQNQGPPDLGLGCEIVLCDRGCPAGLVRQVRYYQILLKAPRPGHKPALFVEDTASAIEDQVVVAAYLIDVEEGNAVLFGEVRQHGLAVFLLAGGEGRSGEVDNGLGSRRHQLLHRIGVVATMLPKVAIVPDILADGDAEDRVLELQDLRLCRRLKVAVLVKDIVSGKQRLFKGPLHPALAQAGRQS